MKMSFAEQGAVVALAVNEMRDKGVPVTPKKVEHVVNAVEQANKDRDLLEGREVAGVYLTPRSPGGKSGGEVVKAVRIGKQEAQQYAPVRPYDVSPLADEVGPQRGFGLSDRKRQELEAQAAAIRAQIAFPGTALPVKDRLQQDLGKIEHLLQLDDQARQQG